jgi:Flp pilus assembly protein TadG
MRTMRFGKCILAERQSGQAMIETILVLWFLLLPVLLNAINMAYFFLAVLNLQSAPHKSNLYAIMGSATPAAQLLPPKTGANSVSTIAYQDLLSSAIASGNAAVRVCRAGTCATAGTTPGNYSFPSLTDTDPENNIAGTAPAFDLSRVDIAYQFNPLIPGAIFNVGLLGFPACGGGSTSCCNTNGTCVLHRFAEMRVMN